MAIYNRPLYSDIKIIIIQIQKIWFTQRLPVRPAKVRCSKQLVHGNKGESERSVVLRCKHNMEYANACP